MAQEHELWALQHKKEKTFYGLNKLPVLFPSFDAAHYYREGWKAISRNWEDYEPIEVIIQERKP
jgi:hypothetical protein